MLHRPFSRFLRWFAALLGTYLVLTAALSTTVDPWRINATRWASSALDASREISQARRVGKAALANLGTWQAVIIGSSRLEIGLDPTHPALPPLRCVNLAMSAANLLENLTVANYALERNPQLKTLIFGVDPGDLHSVGDSRNSNHFYQSPFADNNHSIERDINQVIGWHAFTDSIETLRRHWQGLRPKFSPLGQMLQPGYHENLRAFVESIPLDNAVDQWPLRPQILQQQKVERLAELIARVRRAGIAMYIIIPPQHALKQIHPTEDRPDAMGWENDLLVLRELCTAANARAAPAPPVQLWSFLSFNPFTAAPMPVPDAPCQAVPGWFDLGHASSTLGNRVLDTLFAGQPGAAALACPVGINLLDGEWQAICTAWIDAHHDFCVSHPQDAAWWRGLVARAAKAQAAAHNPN